MGNHTAGKAMGLAAASALKNRSGRTALEILDEICEPWRGCDAEFEMEDPANPGYVHPEIGNYNDPDGPLGILIAEAFGDPGVDYMKGWHSDDSDEQDAAGDRWWGHLRDPARMGPCRKFRKRYDFC